MLGFKLKDRENIRIAKEEEKDNVQKRKQEEVQDKEEMMES